ncbi:protein-glutamate O-methyltransferase CheR [Sphingomonas koreensis]|uniref:Chemotaxis protein CheR n=2 Tax=Sphingomonas koreensis TaxID=93064 RepID=A0A1L6JGB5_9SPHN|nr:chemotaxis protein CheR [Sphingomonas koreensis]RSU18212.1 protein-glutamate O-methyltransferase CheR [Sphingomonas koreensis]RSU23524.1 protein-glutamate O-methyltransferase CheR [Sphingomonas koreensis]RSU38394.1 protein-glutamate O-methyltransferase CheR [Sphingomonas koreensis]RSU39048.1 protein-glutamate O-methyltransferase CheR [Sphingomonas koreensis]
MHVIGNLLEQRTGQQIAANRAWRVETVLKPVLRANDLDTLDQLIGRLAAERNGALAESVVDALLNHETSFFRDAAVLDLVVEAAQALQAETPGRRLRIWSAGCSMGQEPYSLAMLFEEAAITRGMMMPEIVATDVSAAALARARSGRFSQFEIQRGLPVRRMVSWFDSVEGDWVIRPELSRRVQFRQHNLAKESAPAGKFDIVLCRNVLLYFAADVRSRVFRTLRTATRDGGLLVLGAGETVIGQTDAFRPSDRFRGLYLADDARVAPFRAA